ncbi:MAG: LamG domain-containing protein, partial [Verrucomicrobiota bacterium]
MNYIRRTSLAAALALAAGTTSTAVHAALKDGLVSHLAFDGNATDTSTKGNNGTPVGEPTYGAGLLGKAVFCSNAKDGSFANFITLGTVPDVLFGDATDFSVAMWVQLNGFTGDPAFFGNKNWGSGGNLGFVLATDNDRRVQWNFKEEATPRQDFDSPGGQFPEGKWVHVAMTVKRDGKITTYINGQLLNAKDARPAGATPSTIDTDAAGLAVNIGNDGTGAYTDGGSVSHGNTGIDDFGLWRRELSASEVARIYTSGLGGVSLTKIVEPTIAAIGTQSPAPNALNVAPLAPIEVVIDHQATAVNPASVKLTFNGAAVTPTVVSTTTNTVVTLARTNLLAPKSTNSYEITFSDNATPPNTTTSKATFVVANYPSLTLPAPIWIETFESATEGNAPAGWTLSNLSSGNSGTFDLDDPNSDAYMDWVLISKDRVQAIGAAGKWNGPRRLNVSEAYVNGAKVTDLIIGKFLYAESDVRGGNQIQYAISPDVDLSGKKDIFLSFHNIYEQNQDSIGAVEYSIDQGATWLPVLYMIDGPDIKKDANGNVDAVATLTDVNNDAAAYEDPITGEPRGKNYGAFIGVAKSEWATLAPFIQARINDDPVESKRVELFRLPKADNQSKVRLRFAQAGTGSWYFGIDNVGFYSISQVA